MAEKNISSDAITAVILAGGRGERMGGIDKGLVLFAGKPLIGHVLKSIQPQVDHIVISANRHLDQYETYGFPVVQDELSDYQGPLAGLLGAMRIVNTEYVLTVPCDAPCLPDNLVARLIEGINKEGITLSVVHDGQRMQNTCALIDCKLVPSLEDYLESGERKFECWIKNQSYTLVDFSDEREAFININLPGELETLKARADSIE